MNLKKSYLQGLHKLYNLRSPDGFVYIKGMDFNGTEKLSPKSDVFIKDRKIHINDFYMCDRPVTRAEFYNVFKNVTCGKEKYVAIDGISWYEAISYCNKLSAMEGLQLCYYVPTLPDNFDWEHVEYLGLSNYAKDNDSIDVVFLKNNNGYRLPTEIEWEYAVRGGIFLDNYLYSGSDVIDDVYNSKYNIKEKLPNSLGIYDMSCCVFEWCWDILGSNIYPDTPDTGPIVNPSEFSNRVARGGCYYDCAEVNCRYSAYPGANDIPIGFRVVRSVHNVTELDIIPRLDEYLGEF